MVIGMIGKSDVIRYRAFNIFKKAAKNQGIKLKYYSINHFSVQIGENAELYYKGKPFLVDAVINWLPYSKSFLELALKSKNIPMVNSSSSISNCNNKINTDLLLKQINVKQPNTRYFYKYKKYNAKLNFPLIYKKSAGSKGLKMRMFSRKRDLVKVLKDRVGESVYLQEYISNPGWDIRVVVVNNKVIGAIKKYSKDGEFRTHVKHGGIALNYQVSQELNDLALKVNKQMGTFYSGIDIIKDTNGKLLVLEVNSRPGMTLFEDITGISIATEVIKSIKEVYYDHSSDALEKTSK